MTLNRALAIVALSIALAIAALTAVSFALKKAKMGTGLVRVHEPPKAARQTENFASFTGVGQTRALTKAPQGSGGAPGVPVVVTPWFSYQKGDRAFYEEMASKREALRAVVSRYFSERTKEELVEEGERKIKLSLRDEINSRLTLGKIEAVYFSEYTFIE